MRELCVISVLAGFGCGVDAHEPPTVAFVSPAPGASLPRQTLADSGALVADVAIAVQTGGAIAKVAIAAGESTLGDVDAAGALAAQLESLGPTTLTATALDEAGAPLATASVDVTVVAPEIADCKGWLDLYRLDYTTGPASQGVPDPVTVKVPINGVTYRYNGNTSPRTTLFGDCSLIKSLAEGAAIMRAYGIAELVDIGVYNYRCIGGTGTPPNCPNGMSQHAYAKAIDIAAFVAGDGTKYSVLTDWVIDPSGTPTCAAATENDKDKFLHDVICALKHADVWNIVLTPNYNADHRNHFHVDLTKNSDFIKRTTGAAPIAD